MKEQLLAELKELTENVSDTYDDFVYGINCTMKKQDEEDIQSVIDFIKENPERTSMFSLDSHWLLRLPLHLQAVYGLHTVCRNKFLCNPSKHLPLPKDDWNEQIREYPTLSEAFLH